MLIGQVFLVCRTVLHAHFFAFQRRYVGNFSLLGDKQRGVVVIRFGKQHLFFTFRRDVHTGHDRVKALELQARDQAVKSLIGEAALGLHLFTQGIGQIDVKPLDLVAGVNKFKRRIRSFGSETDRFGCRGGNADASQNGGDY
ncbi:hypothetical protein D3C71_1108760 [compost metagenome]